MDIQSAIDRTIRAVIVGPIALCRLVTIAVVLPWFAVAAQPPRDLPAEQFVQTQIQRAISVLNDRSLSADDKVRTFRTLVDQIADVTRITTFVLGKYARNITPGQRERFAPIFREYAQNVYEARLGDYHGENVRVTGSMINRPGDVIVNTVISGGKLTQPLPVAWRVFGAGASWKVVDVQVSGIWLAITEQQDFVSTIDNAGGNVDLLISQLQSQIREHRPLERVSVPER
jgi:phospholipid transport system substrate-binding protein